MKRIVKLLVFIFMLLCLVSCNKKIDIDDNLNNDNSEGDIMYIYINDSKLTVKLENNSSVKELVEILREKDITYTADDYGGFEKVGDIGYTITRNDTNITTSCGDVILYLGKSLCLYYDTNNWTFTKIGHIEGYTKQDLKTILCAGDGEISVRLSLK